MIELTEEEKKLFEESDKEIDEVMEWRKTHPFTKEEEEEMRMFQERCDAEAWGIAYGCEQARKKREALEQTNKEQGTADNK